MLWTRYECTYRASAEVGVPMKLSRSSRFLERLSEIQRVLVPDCTLTFWKARGANTTRVQGGTNGDCRTPISNLVRSSAGLKKLAFLGSSTRKVYWPALLLIRSQNITARGQSTAIQACKLSLPNYAIQGIMMTEMHRDVDLPVEAQVRAKDLFLPQLVRMMACQDKFTTKVIFPCKSLLTLSFFSRVL